MEKSPRHPADDPERSSRTYIFVILGIIIVALAIFMILKPGCAARIDAPATPAILRRSTQLQKPRKLKEDVEKSVSPKGTASEPVEPRTAVPGLDTTTYNQKKAQAASSVVPEYLSGRTRNACRS